MAVSVRTARPDELDTLHDIFVEAGRHVWPADYPAEAVEAMLANNTPDMYEEGVAREEVVLAVDGEEVLGFACAAPGRLRALYVRPPAMRQGIGSTLLEAAEAIARRGDAETITLNATLSAAPFYARHGFRTDSAGLFHFPDGRTFRFLTMYKACAVPVE